MNDLALKLSEYLTVMSMTGKGLSLFPQIIAETGNARRCKDRSFLIAFAGMNTLSFLAGPFNSKHRRDAENFSRFV